MAVFEIVIAETSIRKDDGPFVFDSLAYLIPDQAIDLLDPIMSPYNLDPNWYFDKLNYGNPPAPWAIACLDREYSIAGHIATSRCLDAGISFCPYTKVPDPMPSDYVPGVGVLVFFNKKVLEDCAENSPVFSSIWQDLRYCSELKHWLVILGPLSSKWLNKILPSDKEKWLANRRC